MPEGAWTALAFLIATLLAIVVLIGIAQKSLDVPGTVVALSAVLTGIVSSVVLRERKRGDD